MTLPPLLPSHDDGAILRQAADWAGAGHGVALATVLSTWGSAPRPAGSQLAIRADGSFLGSVSGGCIEGAVVSAGLDCLTDKAPRLLEFGVDDETAWQAGLACGGQIRVLVAPLPAHMQPLCEQLAANRSATLAMDFKTGYHPERDPNGELTAQVDALLAQGNGGLAETQDQAIRVYGPRWRLLVVGAVHVAQALLPMARLAGLETTLIDPRTGFASPERFPGQDINTDWPDEALNALKPDRATAVIVLSHDPKLDDPALVTALQSDAFYIGALGSSRTHAKRRDRLTAEAGLTTGQLDRIQAPIGLKLGGRAPGEIAVSILAQVIAARYAP